MMEWKKVKLGEVCDLIAGFAFKASDFGDYPQKVIKIGDITPPSVSFSTMMGVDMSKYDKEKLAKYLVSYDDFVLAMTGATIGKIGRYIDCEHVYINQRVLLFRPHQDVDKKFIYHALNSPIFQKYIINHIDSDSAQPNISAGTIGKFSLSLPPLPTQRRIAAILSSLDAQIENNNRINRNLEAQAQALFKSWFVDFEPWGGHMPEGWKEVSLDEMTSKFGTGLNPRKNFVLGQGTNYYVTIKNMGNNRIYLDDKCDKIDDEAIKKINKRSKLAVGDILFSGIGTIGRVAMIDELPSNWNTSESVFNLHPAIGYSSYFLYSLLLSDKFQKYVHIHAQGGVQQGIRMASLKAFTMFVPNEETLRLFDAKISPIIKLVRKNEKISDNLASLRDTLLPKLMKGEIEV